MINFTNTRRYIALLLEKLSKSHNIGLEFSKVISFSEETGCIGSQPHHNTGSALTADRKLTICSIKEHSLSSKCVDVRRLRIRVPTETANPVVQIIYDDEDNIGTFLIRQRSVYRGPIAVSFAQRYPKALPKAFVIPLLPTIYENSNTKQSHHLAPFPTQTLKTNQSKNQH